MADATTTTSARSSLPSLVIAALIGAAPLFALLLGAAQ